jgi:hypothetical protein
VSVFRFASLAALLFAADFADQACAEPAPIQAARIPLYPDRPDDTRAGALTYRGGLELRSSNARFGGWSDLAVSSDGTRLLAISDRGHWLRARLSYDAAGDLSNAGDADIVPVLGMDGKPLTGRNRDPEGLALERDGDLDSPAVVSFENNVRIWRYDLSQGPAARPTNIPIGKWVKALHPNAQLEAVTIWKPDTILTFGEAKVAPGDDLLGALEAYPGDGRPHTRLLSVVPHDPFDITSAAKDASGNVFLLERRFSLLGGLGMELRYIPAAAIREGARLDGKVLMNLSYQDANIDNMEGVAVRRGPRGETLIYIVSDDNYSPIQRTLLLMFELRVSG